MGPARRRPVGPGDGVDRTTFPALAADAFLQGSAPNRIVDLKWGNNV
jgi:hypothetical protein